MAETRQAWRRASLSLTFAWFLFQSLFSVKRGSITSRFGSISRRSYSSFVSEHSKNSLPWATLALLFWNFEHVQFEEINNSACIITIICYDSSYTSDKSEVRTCFVFPCRYSKISLPMFVFFSFLHVDMSFEASVRFAIPISHPLILLGVTTRNINCERNVGEKKKTEKKDGKAYKNEKRLARLPSGKWIDDRLCQNKLFSLQCSNFCHSF